MRNGMRNTESSPEMKRADELEFALRSWAPELAESFSSLAYLGSDSSLNWLTESEWFSQFESLVGREGHTAAAEMWRKVLKEDARLPTPALMLILEHMRRNPARTGAALEAAGFRFSRTLANAAFRAADALYESAKENFAGEEIDGAIARFRAALSEFRFSIESQLLTDSTRRIATGKYATAVAMVGRWISVSPGAVTTALQYSLESMSLGNLQPETLTYRLELLVQRFDQTGNEQLLRQALELVSANSHIAKDSKIAEADVRFRLALLSEPGSRHARRYLDGAKESLLSARPSRNSVEEARSKIMLVLVAEAEQGKLAISPTSVTVPRGLLVQMATKPSAQLWGAIRQVVKVLEELRTNRGSVPAAGLSARFLRQIVDGPVELLESNDESSYVEITGWLAAKVSRNRHLQWEAGAAALLAAKRTGNQELALQARHMFDSLARRHSTWPLPRIGIARVQDHLSRSGEDASSAAQSWREAAALALSSTFYSRSNLGGRNEVFAVADARGFLSETFVFKRTTKDKAEHEASMLSTLRDEISRQGSSNLFEVPRSLAIVELPSGDGPRWVHVSQRAAGRLVSELRADELPGVLDSTVDLLAVFHRVAGNPPAGKSAWRSLKGQLKMWSRALFEAEQAEQFVESLRVLFPGDLPLVRKRDGHASNWLLDPAGRIVAIDFESNDFVPIGYDVAQLIEDNGLIHADLEGWCTRLAIMARYLSAMGRRLDESDLGAAYGWFALTRALRLGTERGAGKQLRRHARELCGMLVDCGDETTQRVAGELLHALSRTEPSDVTASVPNHDHRRLSKAMAYQLRHHGPTNGVLIDGAGFAAIDSLALALNVDPSHLLAVVEHPGEPRFEVRDSRIRALYGHSINVVIDAGIKIKAPPALYHGSAWTVLDGIVRVGLMPMRRQMVHLTNTAEEAAYVGSRNGAPLVLSIGDALDADPVAEGIWVIAAVPPHRLSILNPFVDEAGIVR